MVIETKAEPISNIARHNGLKPETLQRHYKHNSSGFHTWDQLEHCLEYVLYSENIGPYLSIDEVSLSKGEVYTLLTNKAGKGKNGTIVAMIEGTLTVAIQEVLNKIPLYLRKSVKEITLDMANNMEAAVRASFPNAKLVTDRFHVVKLTMEALQRIRIDLRWEEMDKENNAIAECKKNKTKYIPEVLSNGDTPKQLLARAKYLLAKKPNEWTDKQKIKIKLLFEKYPVLQKAYNHVLHFRNIYESENKEVAKIRFDEWIKKTETLNIKAFNTVANTIKNNYPNILNFFDNRNTNANAESFNAKIKLFRANVRGVEDTRFFIYRLVMLFA